MYWEREFIAEIGGQPPLADADQADADADAAEAVEEDASVLGLNQEDAQDVYKRQSHVFVRARWIAGLRQSIR